MQTQRLENLESRVLMSQYVVSPTGSDAGNGSAASPWQTLQHAANAVTAGDVVSVKPGQYTGFVVGWDGPRDGKPDAPIVFKGGEGVFIVARNNKTPDGINIEGPDHVVIDGFTVAPKADQDAWRSGIRAVQSDSADIRNNTVQMRASDRYGILSSFTRSLVVQGNNVSGTNNSGIYTSNSAIDPTIKDNTVHDTGGNGLHFNGDKSQGGFGVITGAVVEGNTVYETGSKAGGSAINMDGVQKSKIINNKLYKNHAKGISLYQIDSAEGSSDNLVDSNAVRMADDAKGYALIVKNASVGNTITGNLLVSGNALQGSINVDRESLKGLRSDKNVINAGVSIDDGWSRLTLAQWQKQFGQDLNSQDTAPGVKAASVGNWVTQKVMYVIEAIFLVCAIAAAGAFAVLRRRGLHRWLTSYLLQIFKRRTPAADEEVHLLLCIVDHYEPHNGKSTDAQARQRVSNWVEQYPRLFGKFRDSDGRTPNHSFFYPMEQYHRWAIDEISSLCNDGFGEVEIHLHHDRDTSESLREKFISYKNILVQCHDLLPRHKDTGQAKYGFIHGNWALDNSRPDGCWCGVNNELDVLRETGCYCDFTLPSAPSPTQTTKINSIYYAVDNPDRPRSHDTGVDVGSAPQPAKSLMLIQGPLVLNWSSRKWGIFPRIENACLQGSQPPTMKRLEMWLKARVQVPTRPDWFFVKLHTHGAPEENQKVLLGPAMVKFHQDLAERAAKNPKFHYHYVTAREMYNLARAAEAGWTGSVDGARNFELVLCADRAAEAHSDTQHTYQVAGASH